MGYSLFFYSYTHPLHIVNQCFSLNLLCDTATLTHSLSLQGRGRKGWLSSNVFCLPTPSFLEKVFSEAQGVFSTARPGRSPKRLHWPSLLGYDYTGFKEIKRLNTLLGPNPVCLNVGLMKPWRGSTRSGQKKNWGRARCFFIFYPLSHIHPHPPLPIGAGRFSLQERGNQLEGITLNNFQIILAKF